MASVIGQVFPLGACNVAFNGVDLGLTSDKTKATFKTKRVEAMAGAFGEVPISVFKNGTRVEVDLEILQTDLVNIQGNAAGPIFPEFTLVTGSGKSKVTFGEYAGAGVTKATLKLTSVLSANTPAYDLTLTQAAPISDPVLIYTGAGVQVWAMKFVGCIDLGQSNGALVGSFGDATASGSSVAPSVTGRAPAENASSVPTNSSVVWTMNKALNGTTVNGNSVKLFQEPTSAAGTEVAGTVVLVNNGASTTITFTPTSALTSSKTYMAVLTSEILSQDGNRLVTDTYNFAT